jgi:hypothetical protein
MANAYGSNVSQPGGAATNSVTALNSANQAALNHAAALHAQAPQKQAILNSLTPALISQLNSLLAPLGQTPSTLSLAQLSNLVSIMTNPRPGTNMGWPAAGATTRGTAPLGFGSQIGQATIGIPGSSIGTAPYGPNATFGPNASEALDSSPSALSAAIAKDSALGFPAPTTALGVTPFAGPHTGWGQQGMQTTAPNTTGWGQQGMQGFPPGMDGMRGQVAAPPPGMPSASAMGSVMGATPAMAALFYGRPSGPIPNSGTMRMGPVGTGRY